MALAFVPDPFLVDTPLGRGFAIVLETDHHDYWWTVELQNSGALVTFQQREIKIARNYTLGSRMTTTEMKKILGRSDE